MKVWSRLLLTTMLFTAVPAWSAEQQSKYNQLWSEARRAQRTAVKFKDFTLVKDRSGLVYYYFTKPAHFAHPGVMKRTAYEKDGQWRVATEGWFFGPDKDKPKFNRWMAQAEELNRKMAEEIERTR